MNDDFDFEQFLKDRDAALLSMDRAQIIAYMDHYGIPIPRDEVFWPSIHIARTANRLLPMKARSESKRWLISQGLTPADDGDVPV